MSVSVPLGPIMVGVSGLSLTLGETERLMHPWVGGVVLFARNYSDPGQLRGLTDAIHALRSPALVVAVDQEGGRVQRFRKGFSEIPAAGDIGAAFTADPARGLELAGTLGEVLGEELAWAGIDVNFAPVVDLDAGNRSVIGARAFHADPAAVVELAGMYLGGMKKWGVRGVVKHYPGHGSALGDTHTGEVRDNRDLNTIERTDLVVYRGLIELGIEGLMSSHVTYSAVGATPASFAPFWLHHMLRDVLKFQGLVFSDDLSMGAANPAAPLHRRVGGVLEAGCDVALVCNELDHVPAMLGHFHGPPPDPGLERVGGERPAMSPALPAQRAGALARAIEGSR